MLGNFPFHYKKVNLILNLRTFKTYIIKTLFLKHTKNGNDKKCSLLTLTEEHKIKGVYECHATVIFPILESKKLVQICLRKYI